MGQAKSGKSAAIGLATLCSACGFVYDDQLDGPYRLVAVDVREQMILCVSDGSACVGDELPGPTIFAAGANSDFITIARHPLKPDGGIDRRVTQFYYVVRTAGDAKGARPANLKGPFDESQFQLDAKRLRLPAFSRVFHDLE